MTNKERQRSLDKKKYYASQKEGYNLSGKMDYCKYCSKKAFNESRCTMPQEERVAGSFCAKAYNRQDYVLKQKSKYIKKNEQV